MKARRGNLARTVVFRLALLLQGLLFGCATPEGSADPTQGAKAVADGPITVDFGTPVAELELDMNGDGIPEKVSLVEGIDSTDPPFVAWEWG